jgi:MFS family permease
MAAGWVMHGLLMVSAVVLLVDQSPGGRAATLTFYGSATSFGMSLGAALGGLALAGSGYFALGMCTVALPLAAAILVWLRRPGPRTAIEPGGWISIRSISNPRLLDEVDADRHAGMTSRRLSAMSAE